MTEYETWWAAEKERRKFGTDSPHDPTDEFVIQAFAEGASRLWPDSRDPGWQATFRRWLEARDAQIATTPGLRNEPNQPEEVNG